MSNETFHTLFNELYVVTMPFNIKIIFCENIIYILLVILCCRHKHSYLTFVSNLGFLLVLSSVACSSFISRIQ